MRAAIGSIAHEQKRKMRHEDKVAYRVAGLAGLMGSAAGAAEIKVISSVRREKRRRKNWRPNRAASQHKVTIASARESR